MKQYFLFLWSFAFCTLNAMAQPGQLDSSFGINGISITTEAELTKMLILNDDKILVLNPYNTIMRFLPDGRIDPGYGNNGILDISAGSIDFNGSNAFALQSDRKLVVTGFDRIADTFVITLHRFMPDGTADLTFGDNNSVITKVGGHNQGSQGIAIQEDGKIVVNGIYTLNENTASQPFVIRYNEDGSLDKTFGNEGILILTFKAQTQSIAIQKNGKIILAGGGLFDDKFFLVCLTPTGELDKTFGKNGTVTTDFDLGREFINQIVLQPDGKIVAAGAGRELGSADSTPYMAVARYNADGSLDNSFGIGGKAKIIFDYISQANSVDLQENGKIVVAGVMSNQDGSFALTRLLDNGNLDSTFGIDGKITTDLGSLGDQIFDIGLQKNGDIIAGGTQVLNTVALARYLGDPTKPRPTIAQIKRWIRNHILHFEDANTNAAYYVIEKSTASNGAFVPVTKIAANAATTNYSYTLPEVATQSTYRIKAVNKDNSITFSSPISSSDPAIAGALLGTFKVYPNPAKDRITVETAGTVQLRLQNSTGRVLLTQTVNGKGSIDISKLPNGIYYVVNTVNGESLKVVKE